MLKPKTVIFSTLLLGTLIAPLTVLAAPYLGGNWSYGGHHDPNNWGAFSNFYHPSSSHWSRVVRDSDSSSRKGTAGPGGTSRAFINTNLGEVAYFSADLSD
ncbi:lactococcin 972 family bacteriocin [Streptococcus suis]|uniref:Lactococcin 972 family bacteriocin n=1 Tax=Streptococcus suis TaxID=1307 RepID=A0A0Z8F9M5_STRSU|nr:lactococcin 972 family bacteriocin [Streptococcus suis]NQH36361.1 lactococcin 972 family bacteriocin [Streptococcus suis]NQN73629.1 lactococcin 972 family bacteriocin [Streptococcus suis]NQN77925.1 lactococcin 972 family bacteriocin [Streptococcus suis]CYU76466.1 lactococcin 972 family bacteriocin [Streptococcus suis]CYV43941.1 lactococcin 972 family bacteriocin [Streptococcus suis]